MDFRRPLSVVTPTLDGDVLAVLAGAEEEFSGRRIHQMVRDGSESGVRKAAERLVAQGIVLSRPAGRANLYRLNRDHLAAPYVQGLATLRAELFDALHRAISEWDVPPLSAMVFGSVARGEAGPLSDLDLLVVKRSGVEVDGDAWREQIGLIEDLGSRWTGNEARVLEYAEWELSDPAVSAVVASALDEGVELYGSRHILRRLVAEREG